MNDNYYNVSAAKLILLMIPPMLRGKGLASLCAAISVPFARLVNDIQSYRATQLYRLSHNGQLCIMESMLNDTFDNTLRRITVVDEDEDANGIFIYLRNKGLPKMTHLRAADRSIMLQRRGYRVEGGFDFWVNVPTDVTASDDRIRAMVNVYRLASKRFNINRI